MPFTNAERFLPKIQAPAERDCGVAPDLWVFGHTHHDIDQTVGKTRVLSHQRGYVGHEVDFLEFSPAVVEL